MSGHIDKKRGFGNINKYAASEWAHADAPQHLLQ
jgi:hypothetical protein